MTTTQGTNLESVRRQNLSVLLRQVHRAGEISRSALTATTGLNRTTVGVLVGDLAARGLVREAAAIGRGSRGRPSPLVKPRRDRVAVLAADVEVATISFAVAGLGGHLHDRVLIDREPGRRTPEATVEDLARLVDGALRDLGPGCRVPALGVSVAGVVRKEDGFVHLAPNLGWRDVPLAAMLAERIDVDLPIRMGNEADLGALAEHVRGAGVGVDNLIYVSSEIGVGGGFIVDGRPLDGAAGYAGEIGHMVVNSEGIDCHCGGRGCLETEAGEWALLRHLGRSSTNEREAVAEVLREASAGSARALEALGLVGRWLGVGLASLVNIFNPNRIVLGGLFAKAHPYIADRVARRLDAQAQPPHRAMVSVVPASLGEDSALLGAVELALQPLLADPTMIPRSEAPSGPAADEALA